MKRGHNIFVLTGAGISAESGIPVFQGTNWRGYSHYQLANIDAWESNPQLVWQYYSDRRRSAHDAKPNAAHKALAALEQSLQPRSSGEPRSSGGPGAFFLCTQNVDNLHEAAGSTGAVHIHGKLFESKCAADCGKPPFADPNAYPDGELPRCTCGALVRPNVCWFGELPHHLDRIYDELELCDLFVAIGTSGSVQPVASFAAILKQKPNPAKTMYLGLAEPANAHFFDEIHLGEASVLVPTILSELASKWV